MEMTERQAQDSSASNLSPNKKRWWIILRPSFELTHCNIGFCLNERAPMSSIYVNHISSQKKMLPDHLGRVCRSYPGRRPGLLEALRTPWPVCIIWFISSMLTANLSSAFIFHLIYIMLIIIECLFIIWYTLYFCHILEALFPTPVSTVCSNNQYVWMEENRRALGPWGI